MSNALAIAGVTATLQYLLNLVYNSPGAVMGAVSISALAPDIVQTSFASGASTPLHVNLFLHQIGHNPSWRNIGLPSLAGDGSTLLQTAPLALDLHYLLTAYASEDTQAEALLGFAVLMLHENAILPRGQIRTALSGLPSTNPLASVLSASGLADQVEMIKVTPSTLGREEMAWLWTALKADYRPTYCFQVSVVLIEPQAATTVALPVLSRSITAQAGPPAQITEVQPPQGQMAATPGQIVTVVGQSLAGANQAILINQRLGIKPPAITLTPVSDTSVSFTVPDVPASVPAGVYSLSLLFVSSGAQVQSTNSLPMPVAPSILTTPAPAATANSSGTLVTLSCKPQVLPNQNVSLSVGSNSVPAVAFESPTASLSFQFPTIAAGSYLLRLRVDGVESPVSVNWSATPPAFTGPFLTV
jgi:hypothetical protein